MNEGNDVRRATMRICCLPVAGDGNPYQRLMMQGLRQDERLEVLQGTDGKLFAAIRTVLAQRPDVLHYDWMYRYFLRRRRWWTWLHAPIFLAELLVVRYLLGCRIVWTLHNLGTHDTTTRQLEVWVRRRFARLCDWIRVFHPSTVERAAAYLDLDPSRFVVIPEGSYVGYYPSGVSRAEARQRLGIEEDALLLLYLGSVRPYKGLDELISAFKQAAEAHWSLLIAGPPLDASYTAAIQQACEGTRPIRLDFRFIPDEELQFYFRACDVVVLPFRSIENSGSVILAMGFAKPVVAPARGVLPERLRRQPELLYQDDDLRGALERLKGTSQWALQEIGRRNYEEVQRYRWEDFSQAFVAEESKRPVVA